MTVRHPDYDLRRRYHARVRMAAVVAIALHGLVFATVPPYKPRPAPERRAKPLRLVTLSGAWGVAPADAGFSSEAVVPGTATPPERRGILPEGASLVASRVTSELAEDVVPRSGMGATIRGGGEVQGGAPSGSVASLEEEAPPVFYNFDTAPRAIRRVEPEYPVGARSREEEGTVVVNVNIDERGRILRAWVAAKNAPEALVSAALDAAYQFQFTPGKQRDVPVKCTVAIPFRFHLTILR